MDSPDPFRPFTLGDRFLFELRSALGRALLSRRPPDVGTPRLLNVGCGNRLLDGWVNADFFRRAFWRAPRGFWMVDLRYPLPCPADHFDGAFCEHTLEHLTVAEAEALLREVARTLRPGATLRVSVPGLEPYLAFYAGRPSPGEFGRWPARGDALRTLAHGWGHASLWDTPLLVRALEGAGLAEVTVRGHGEGRDARLLQESPARRWESIFVEGTKVSGR